MNKIKIPSLVGICLAGLILSTAIITRVARAEAQNFSESRQGTGATPQCNLDACIEACKLDLFVWGSEATFNGYYNYLSRLTGCDEPKVEEFFKTALDVVAEIAEAETGPILNCAEANAGFESVCQNECGQNACRYAPNLRTSITNSDPAADGIVTVNLNNAATADPATNPTATTGKIDVYAELQMTGWDETIPFAKMELNNLGYPGLLWATHAIANCTGNTYYCLMMNDLANTPMTYDMTIPLPQYRGVYNLENLVTQKNNANIANPAGYAGLIEDGNSVTVQAGLSGILYIREDDGWDGTWDRQKVETWNSYDGPYTVTNTECQNSVYCWFMGRERVNRDTFLMVLDAPCEDLLLGDYTVRIDTPLDHDKDTSNNNNINNDAVKRYSINGIPADCAAQTDAAITEDVPANGVVNGTFTREYIKYYRVTVPTGTSLLDVTLEGPASSDPNDNLDLLLSQGSYPLTTRSGVISDDYTADDSVGYPDRLRIPAPKAGDWFIEVYHKGSILYNGSFKLYVNIESAAPAIMDINEGQYHQLYFAPGQSSQLFRVNYPSQLGEMTVTFWPIYPWDTGFRIYMCHGSIPQINYHHTYFPGWVCDGRIAFNQSLADQLTNTFTANVSQAGSSYYYILVDHKNGPTTAGYNLDVGFTWTQNEALETEPNDDCANANVWSPDNMGIPRRGYFKSSNSNSGDTDSYSITFVGNGESVDMETYLASVPQAISPDLTVLKKAGQDYQVVAANTSAGPGGSPRVSFALAYGQEYCIQVHSRTNVDVTNDQYSLYLHYAGIANGEQREAEPNNDASTANEWPGVGVDIRGIWGTGVDKDYYKWTVPASSASLGVYFVSIDPTPTVPLHSLIVYKEYGLNGDGSPNISEINQGSNETELAPVGLYFSAASGDTFYFELTPQDSASGAWYRLKLQKPDDLGGTCYGAPKLKLGQPNISNSSYTNALTSQLGAPDLSGATDTDCFHLMSGAGGSFTVIPPKASENLSTLIQIFRYRVHAFDFQHIFDTPVLQVQKTSTSGSNLQGPYTIGFTADPNASGLAFNFPASNADIGYCACISGIPGPGGTSDQNGNGSQGGNGTTQGAGQIESENNGSDSNADIWDTTSPIKGRLNTKADTDIFKFTAEQSGIYNITLSNGPANINPKVYLSRSNTSLVIAKTDNSLGQPVMLEFDANKGEAFFIKIMAQSPTTVSDQYYQLSAVIIPDPTEPNNTEATATAWDAFNSSIQGYFYERVSGPSDVYKFTIPQKAGSILLSVNLNNVPVNVAANMFLKKADGTTIASSSTTSAGVPVSLLIDASPGETYLVTVIPRIATQVSDSPYTLSVITLPDPNEPNDSFATAIDWDYKNKPSIQGYFADLVTGPGDYYKIIAPQGSKQIAMTIKLEDVSANVSPSLYIENSVPNVVKSKSANKGESISLTFNASPGATYYVLVKPLSTQMVSSQLYTLSITYK